MINAIIVDDEMKGRQYLKQLIEKFVPQVKIIGEAEDTKQAIVLIDSLNPDLVFLDIEMPGQTGIEMLRQMQDINFEVVFVTAFNRYAVEAFRLGAVDYLLKPASPSDLQEAVARVINNRSNHGQQKSKLAELTQHFGQAFTKITVPTMSGFEFVDFVDIISFQSDGNYSNIRLKEKKTITATRQLGEFEELLLNYNFFRIHKSFIINLDHIKKYTKGDGGSVMMSDGSEIDVSRRIKDAFLKRIQL